MCFFNFFFLSEIGKKTTTNLSSFLLVLLLLLLSPFLSDDFALDPVSFSDLVPDELDDFLSVTVVDSDVDSLLVFVSFLSDLSVRESINE